MKPEVFDAIIAEIEELQEYGPTFDSVQGQRLNQLTTIVIEYHERTYMRRFFLRTADPVRNFFSGITLCRHATGHAFGTTKAKECLQCLRELVQVEGKRDVLKPNMPVACVVSQLVGDIVYYGISACSLKDDWNKQDGRDIAELRLSYAVERDKFMRAFSHDREVMKTVRGTRFTGTVSMNAKPVKVNVLRQIATNERLPHHVRKAALDWIEAHVVTPKPIH